MERKIKSFYTDLTEAHKLHVEMEDNSTMTFDRTEESIRNLDSLLKEQAKERIEEIDVELDKTLDVTGVDAATCLVGYGGIVSAVICGIYGTAAMVHGNADNMGTILLSVAGGSAGLAVISKCILSSKEKRHFKKKQELREEKEKLEFINDNTRILRSFPKYKNALAGLSNDQSNHIKFCPLPFTIVDVDKFKIEDLERIVDNIRLENKLAAEALRKQEQKVKQKKMR